MRVSLHLVYILWINHSVFHILVASNEETALSGKLPVHKIHWTYDGRKNEKLGMKKWYQEFPDCGGRQQSPINIDTRSTVMNRKLDIVYRRYNMPLINNLMENNGHTVQVSSLDENVPSISGPALNNMEYRFKQFHFHWGMSGKGGSEHKLNGRRTLLELHLVHYNTKYKDFDEALTQKDGLAVLGVFYQRGGQNPALRPFLMHANQIPKYKDKFRLKAPIVLQNLLPMRLKPFFRYYGSLTTPPCYETVTWILYRQFATISPKQALVFRRKKGEERSADGGYMFIGDNHRGVQDLNGRIVEMSGV